MGFFLALLNFIEQLSQPAFLLLLLHSFSQYDPFEQFSMGVQCFVWECCAQLLCYSSLQSW